MLLGGVGGLGLGGWGLGAPGPDGQVLPGIAQNPARLVYGSAALVASLRGQHCHFATLPISYTIGEIPRVLSTLREQKSRPPAPTFSRT